MIDYYSQLDSLEKMFFLSALLGGLSFLVRTILMFIGGDADGGGGDVADDFNLEHSDADASVKLLSVQGLTGFFMMFGLVGLALSQESQAGALWSIAGGLLAGLFTLWLTAKIFTSMKKLQSDGSLDMNAAIGAQGTVYLTIPENNSGQVQLNVQDRLRIFNAISHDKTEIKTGERVQVLRLVNGNVLVVSRV
ncbi:hypothetical protein GF406_01515 [candidate division KSB1 bacterium]|nr:hypothetical protein [candidate division KSB1 bacterium]